MHPHRAIPAARPHTASLLLLILALALSAGGGTLATRAPAAAAAPAAPAGLVAAFSFDAGSGSTVADASGTGNSGTVSGAGWTTAGKHGGALSFDGASDAVTVPDAPSLDLRAELTLEAWVRPTVLGRDWRTVALKQGSGGAVYGLYAGQSQGRPVALVDTGRERSAVGTALPTDTWTHLATTFDGSTLRLYRNGALVASRSAHGSIATSDGPLRLGGDALTNACSRARSTTSASTTARSAQPRSRRTWRRPCRRRRRPCRRPTRPPRPRRRASP